VPSFYTKDREASFLVLGGPKALSGKNALQD